MSDETNAIEELRQCFIGLFGYSQNWPEHGNVPLAMSSKAALLKDEVADLTRQLTAERERVNSAVRRIYEQRSVSNAQDDTSEFRRGIRWGLDFAVNALSQLEPTYALANPCPNCGATDRAHTCPNWNENEVYQRAVAQIRQYIFGGYGQAAVPNAKAFLDAILDAARLAKGT